MSHPTPHKFHGAPVRFDELEPFGEIAMSTKTFEHLMGTTIVDPTRAVRREPVQPVAVHPQAEREDAVLESMDPESPQTETGEDADPAAEETHQE